MPGQGWVPGPGMGLELKVGFVKRELGYIAVVGLVAVQDIEGIP